MIYLILTMILTAVGACICIARAIRALRNLVIRVQVMETTRWSLSVCALRVANAQLEAQLKQRPAHHLAMTIEKTFQRQVFRTPVIRIESRDYYNRNDYQKMRKHIFLRATHNLVEYLQPFVEEIPARYKGPLQPYVEVQYQLEVFTPIIKKPLNPYTPNEKKH